MKNFNFKFIAQNAIFLIQIRYFANPVKFGDKLITTKKKSSDVNSSQTQSNQNVASIKDAGKLNNEEHFVAIDDTTLSDISEAGDFNDLLNEIKEPQVLHSGIIEESSEILVDGYEDIKDQSNDVILSKSLVIFYKDIAKWNLRVTSLFTAWKFQVPPARKVIFEIVPLDHCDKQVNNSSQLAARVTFFIAPALYSNFHLTAKRVQTAIDICQASNGMYQPSIRLPLKHKLSILRYNNFNYSGSLSLLTGTFKLNNVSLDSTIARIKVLLGLSLKHNGVENSEGLSFAKIVIFNYKNEKLCEETLYFSGLKKNVNIDETGSFWNKLFSDPRYDQCELEWPLELDSEFMMVTDPILMNKVKNKDEDDDEDEDEDDDSNNSSDDENLTILEAIRQPFSSKPKKKNK